MEIERLPRGQSFGDKHRAAWAQWAGMPPGLTPELASKFMLNLHGGMTIRDMTFNGEHYICSLARFEKHCQLNPEWGVAARKLSWKNFKKKSRESSHQRRRTAEMCLKGLHPMVGDNVMISHKKNRQWRQCLACLVRAEPFSADPQVFRGRFAPVFLFLIAHLGTLVETAQACLFDGRNVYEDILAAIVGLNKSVTLGRVEPLHCTCRHVPYSPFSKTAAIT
jgi:hypothetical protein